jgi:hydroxymethylbilane synthase
VRGRLVATGASFAEPASLSVQVIRTTGDRVLDRPLADVGGKGLFSKEIDEAMLAGRIDIAVHSVKDLPTWLPEGIVLAAVLPREDPRDVLIAAVSRIADLPPGAIVGTSSPRRQAQILARRPNLCISLLRGNVQTRLARVAEGAVAATLLARAGLCRLGLLDAGVIIEPEEMLPAVGQGAIGVTCRTGDAIVREMMASIDDPETMREITAERSMLAVLDGSCRTPIGGLARHERGVLILRGMVARPDGSLLLEGVRGGNLSDGPAMGRDLGRELRSRAGPGFFEP